MSKWITSCTGCSRAKVPYPTGIRAHSTRVTTASVVCLRQMSTEEERPHGVQFTTSLNTRHQNSPPACSGSASLHFKMKNSSTYHPFLMLFCSHTSHKCECTEALGEKKSYLLIAVQELFCALMFSAYFPLCLGVFFIQWDSIVQKKGSWELHYLICVRYQRLVLLRVLMQPQPISAATSLACLSRKFNHPKTEFHPLWNYASNVNQSCPLQTVALG